MPESNLYRTWRRIRHLIFGGPSWIEAAPLPYLLKQIGVEPHKVAK